MLKPWPWAHETKYAVYNPYPQTCIYADMYTDIILGIYILYVLCCTIFVIVVFGLSCSRDEECLDLHVNKTSSFLWGFILRI